MAHSTSIREWMWSITYDQLMDLNETLAKQFGEGYSSMTMRDINRKIIEPSCRRTGKSYALMLNPGGLKVDAFITHSWDEPFEAFVDSIRRVFWPWIERPNLWICAFALIQGDQRTIRDQLGRRDVPLSESPFVKALESASTFVVVRNSSTDLYSRIWCVCELIYAKRLGLYPSKTFVTGPDKFADSDTSCLEAKASKREDKAKILKVLLNEYAFEEVDAIVDQFRKHEAPGMTTSEAMSAGAAERVFGRKSLIVAIVAVLLSLSFGYDRPRATAPSESTKSVTATALRPPRLYPAVAAPTVPSADAPVNLSGFSSGAPTPVITSFQHREERCCAGGVWVTYTGGFNQRGERHGVGTLKWDDGHEYEGSWQNGKIEGQGILRFPDGAMYEGEFKHGKKEGRGNELYANADEYEGEWKDGKKEGLGTYKFADGAIYEGEWKNNEAEGTGTYWFANGDAYEGQFKDSKREGRGTQRYADGDVYKGDYKDDKKEGRGTYRFANGQVEVGRYRADADVGEGVRWSADQKTAWRLTDGKVVGTITPREADEIAARIGLPVPK